MQNCAALGVARRNYKDLATKKLVALAHAQSCEDGHDQRPLPFIHFDCTAPGAATMLTC